MLTSLLPRWNFPSLALLRSWNPPLSTSNSSEWHLASIDESNARPVRQRHALVSYKHPVALGYHASENFRVKPIPLKILASYARRSLRTLSIPWIRTPCSAEFSPPSVEGGKDAFHPERNVAPFGARQRPVTRQPHGARSIPGTRTS